MATVGGDILELRVKHPELGEHSFFPKSNEGNTFDFGGVRTNDDANQITGSREMIVQKNVVRGMLEVVVANDMNTREDATFAAALAESSTPGNYVLSMINGTIWGFDGHVVGDIQPDLNAATFTLKLAFPRATKLVG